MLVTGSSVSEAADLSQTYKVITREVMAEFQSAAFKQKILLNRFLLSKGKSKNNTHAIALWLATYLRASTFVLCFPT